MNNMYVVFLAVAASVFGPTECWNVTDGTWLPPTDNSTDFYISGTVPTVNVTPPNFTVSNMQGPSVSMSTEDVPSVSGNMAITDTSSSQTSSNPTTTRRASSSSAFSSPPASNPTDTSQAMPNPTLNSASPPTAPPALSSSPWLGTLNSLLSTLSSSQTRATATTAADSTNPTAHSTPASTPVSQTARLGPPVVITNRQSPIVSSTASDGTTQHATQVLTEERTFQDPRAGQVLSTGEKLTTGMLAAMGVLALLCIGLGVCALSAKSNESITKVHPIGGNKTLVSNDNGGVVAIT
ncbi:uncharacterized protein LOC144904180 [Branchiostoma floridae x Branchiostoma belcheri]